MNYLNINDNLLSIAVPFGAKIEVFEHDFFAENRDEGWSAELTSEGADRMCHDLVALGGANKISGFRIGVNCEE